MTAPLVLIHGWGLTPAVWAPLAAAARSPVRSSLLSDALADAILPALPGPGMTPAEWADALAATLPQGCTVVAWSLGAQLALVLARRHPHKVTRLLLTAASPCFVARADWPWAMAAATMADFQADFAAAPAATLKRFVALQALGDAQRRQVAATLTAARSPDNPALAWGLELLASADLRRDISHVTQPVLLIHGAADRLMPLAAAEWLARTLPAARLTVFFDAGHAPFLSRPEEFAARLADFIDGRNA